MNNRGSVPRNLYKSDKWLGGSSLWIVFWRLLIYRRKLKCVHLFQNFGIIKGKVFIHTSFRELLNDQPNLSNHLTERGITPRNYSESLVANAASKIQIPVGRLGLWETTNLSQFEDFWSTELWEEKVQKRGAGVHRLSLAPPPLHWRMGLSLCIGLMGGHWSEQVRKTNMRPSMKKAPQQGIIHCILIIFFYLWVKKKYFLLFLDHSLCFGF